MVTAAQVKELREKTGAGMMDCKKVLAETDGNEEKAIDHNPCAYPVGRSGYILLSDLRQLLELVYADEGDRNLRRGYREAE